MSSKKILVTGGAGYIGSHTCKQLAQAGYLPITFDSLERGHRQAVKWGPLEEGCLMDRRRIEEVLKQHRPEAILHFAAFVDVNESTRDPAMYYRNNTSGSLNLIEAALSCGISRMIFSSTAAVYGEPDQSAISERQPVAPINSYGTSKWMTEQMLADIARSCPFEYVVLRYFNASGADIEGMIGSYHKNPTHLIPSVLEAILGTRPKLTVYGTDYPTRDGTAIRDYIHVTDLADAHICALKYLEKGGKSDTFNLGNGQGFSVKEVIAAAEKVTGRKVPFTNGARRAGDPAGIVADAGKARDRLNWAPRYSSIESVIQTTWDWMTRTE